MHKTLYKRSNYKANEVIFAIIKSKKNLSHFKITHVQVCRNLHETLISRFLLIEKIGKKAHGYL